MAESPFPIALEVTHEGDGLLVEFQEADGLIFHTLSLITPLQRIAVLSSCQIDPKSSSTGYPCFTEIHKQNDTVFLTGSNGPCHWSMSIKSGDLLAENRSMPHGGFLFFDVASRLKAPVANLGSFYHLNQELACSIGDTLDSGILIAEAVQNKDLLVVGTMPTEYIQCLPSPASKMSQDSTTLRLSSLEKQGEVYPATYRWSYAILLG